MDEALVRAYAEAVYWVFGPQGYIPLRAGERSAALEELLAHSGAGEWAFVTACNPGSELLSPAENDRRVEALEAVLYGRYSTFRGAGVGTGGDWPPEPSLLILGISEEEALQLARRFGQNAIVSGTLGEPARLVWC